MKYSIDTSELCASEEVVLELATRDDDVFAWADGHKGFTVPLDDDIQYAVAEILRHHPKLVDTRKNRSAADPFVIAVAKRESCVVVTGEGATGSLKRPNIPDVCDAIGVTSMRLVDLIRAEGWSFG